MGKQLVVEDLRSRFKNLPGGAWDQPPSRAAVIPIADQGQISIAGFLVAGLNPYLPYDENYREFVGLLAGQIAAGIASARAYQEERRRAEALAELDRAKTVFFSNVSHEFRTPLTLMLGLFKELVARCETTAAERALVAPALRNAHRLTKLIDTLLDFSRIEAGRVEASYEATDLAALTAELASNFRSACEKGRAHSDGRLPTPPRAGPCRPGYVGEDRSQPGLQRLQIHAGGRHRGAAWSGGRRCSVVGPRYWLWHSRKRAPATF